MTDILLITSTIAPPAQSFLLAVTDAETRLSQYRAALAFYLEQLAAGTFDRIVYMDNSGHPLDALRDQVAARGSDRTELTCRRRDRINQSFFKLF